MIRLLLNIHRRLPKPLRKSLFHTYSLATRAMTMGVRIYGVNVDGQVLLVRHTYTDGWHLPGGGVERSETLHQAATKELREETGFEATSTMKLFHVFKNTTHSKFDHVALFTCTLVPLDTGFEPNLEIAEIGFFDPKELPVDTTESTRNRIAEVLNGLARTDVW